MLLLHCLKSDSTRWNWGVRLDMLLDSGLLSLIA